MSTTKRASPAKDSPAVPPTTKQERTEVNGTPETLAGRLLNVATAQRKDSTRWSQASPLTWDGLLHWLDLDHPADHKDCGGYVPALLRNGRKRREDIVSRSVLTLDADKAGPTFLADVGRVLPGVAVAVHTTWRHGVEGSRYRLLAPLSRDLDGSQYTHLACAVRDALGEQWGPDKGCPEPERFMWRPSTQGEYLWHVQAGDLLDVDAWLRDDEQPPAQPQRAGGPLHPYAEKATASELARLDECDLLGWQGPGWNTTTYEVACNLIEFANSPWSGYALDRAEADLMDHAPTDDGFGPAEHAKCWASAEQSVGGKGRPHPDGDPNDDFEAASDDSEKKGGKAPGLAVRLRQHVQKHHEVFPAGHDGRIFAQPKEGGRAELLTGPFVVRAAGKLGDGSASLTTSAKEAAAVLCARAANGQPRPLALRVHYNGQRIVLDLAQRGNTRCVVVTPEGWTVEDVPPPEVVFQMSGDPLPEPARGGSLDELRTLLRWKEDDSRWLLVKGWLPTALLATEARPMLGLFGQQGSAKSTTGRFVVGLVDPKPPGVLGGAFGKKRSDDETKALKSYVVAWDNVSTLSEDGADFLSRLVTGDLIERRMLYSDAEVVTIQYRRTGVVTGINVPRGVKPDTLDRFVMLTLRPVGERATEAEMEEQWTRVQPRALAGVLDLAVRMLAGMDRAENPAGLRMADYAKALWAIDPALYHAYAENVRTAQADMAAEDPFLAVLVEWLRDCEGQTWEGTAEAARQGAGFFVYDPKQWWPRNAKSFSDQVTRTAELLRAVGVTVTDRRSDGKKLKCFTLA